MSQKAYISNISKRWPVDGQLAAIAAAGIEAVYKDELKLNRGQYLKPELLKQRTDMFRPTSRNGSKVVVVQSLGVLACTTQDFFDVLGIASDQGVEIRELHRQLVIKPNCSPKVLRSAVEAFEESKQADKNLARGQAGGIESGRRKAARIAAMIELIRDRWPLPSEHWPTATLLKEAKLPYNTAALKLGRRPIVQANFLAAQKRKAKREGRAG